MHLTTPRPRTDGAIAARARQRKVTQRGINKTYCPQMPRPRPLQSHHFPRLSPPGTNLNRTSTPFRLHPHEAETLSLALQLLKADIAIGQRQYPHQFKNYGRLPLRYRGPYYEFPLLDHGKFFDGVQNRSPGLKRIVFTREGELANIVSHDKGVKDGFRRIA